MLGVANKDGGAHVDATLDAAYEALSRANSMGFGQTVGDEPGTVGLSFSFEGPRRVGDPDATPLANDPVLASVRQIAHELIASLDASVADDGDTITLREEICPIPLDSGAARGREERPVPLRQRTKVQALRVARAAPTDGPAVRLTTAWSRKSTSPSSIRWTYVLRVKPGSAWPSHAPPSHVPAGLEQQRRAGVPERMEGHPLLRLERVRPGVRWGQQAPALPAPGSAVGRTLPSFSRAPSARQHRLVGSGRSAPRCLKSRPAIPGDSGIVAASSRRTSARPTSPRQSCWRSQQTAPVGAVLAEHGMCGHSAPPPPRTRSPACASNSNNSRQRRALARTGPARRASGRAVPPFRRPVAAAHRPARTSRAGFERTRRPRPPSQTSPSPVPEPRARRRGRRPPRGGSMNARTSGGSTSASRKRRKRGTAQRSTSRR